MILKKSVKKPSPEPEIVPRRTVSKTEKPVSKEVAQPVKSDGCGHCSHGKDSHYGSLNHQCNVRDCRCEAWK